MLLPLQSLAENEILQNSVDQLSDSTIKLAEAAANFGALKIMFGVFIIFIFIMMMFYFYQMISYSKKISDIHNSSKKIENYFEDTSNRTLGKAQAGILIRRSFNSLAQNVKYTILRTRLENKTGNANEGIVPKDQIQAKIARLVHYEYAELGSFLTNFDCDDKALAEAVNMEDAQILVDFMIEQIYLPEEQYSISNMDKETDILLNGIKLEVIKNLG